MSCLERYETAAVTGLVIGICFAYFGRGFEQEAQVLAALATIQGSFLAIVISVFLLSSQVTANEFGPLTLEEIGGSQILNSLVLAFVASILIDILYIVTHDSPLLTIPTDWNLTIGVTTGVATACFMSLIPAKVAMSKSVDPKEILESSLENINWESVGQTSSEDPVELSSDILAPKRTPLVVIEQIIYAAKQRNDEFTLRQSIHYMYLGICDLIESDCAPPDDDDRYDIVFRHWGNCIEIGTDGGKQRLLLLGKAHCRIIESLFKNDISSPVGDRLKELEQIQLTVFREGHNDARLLNWYTYLTKNALDTKSNDEIEQILSSLLAVCNVLVTKDENTEWRISGERRDVISNCFSTSIDCLRIIGEHNHSQEKSLRRTSRNTIDQVDELLSEVCEKLNEVDNEEIDSEGIEQNILSEVRESLISVSTALSDVDSSVSENLLKAAMEIAIYQEQSGQQFWSEFSDSGKQIAIQHILDSIVKSVEDGRYRTSLTAIEDPTESTLSEFTTDLADKIST